MGNARILQRIGLTPGNGRANDGTTILLPGVDQRLQKRRFTGAGDTDKKAQTARLTKRIDGRKLRSAVYWLAREVETRPGDGCGDLLVTERAVPRARRQAGKTGHILFEGDLGTCPDPEAAVLLALQKADLLTVDLNATLLDQIGDPLDVLRAFDASRNETPCGMGPERVPVENSSCPKLLSQFLRRNRISQFVALSAP